ncbi:MAG: hypothetical protein IPJ65_03060 [Archangiaceae bacterium]|nr:hypothetical protein [Archangiaceae bacterium]
MSPSVLLLTLAADPTGWTPVEKSDGIELFQRELPGERLVELKAITRSKLPVEALCTSAAGGDTLDKREPDIIMRRVVSNAGGVKVTYEQVGTPVISDRDYAVATRRIALPNGGCSTRFEAANQYAPKLPDGFVRIEKLRGSWAFEPQPNGEVLCTYTIFTDPGGPMPAVFIEGPRKKAARTWVKLVLDRAAASAADGGR